MNGKDRLKLIKINVDFVIVDEMTVVLDSLEGKSFYLIFTYRF